MRRRQAPGPLATRLAGQEAIFGHLSGEGILDRSGACARGPIKRSKSLAWQARQALESSQRLSMSLASMTRHSRTRLLGLLKNFRAVQKSKSSSVGKREGVETSLAADDHACGRGVEALEIESNC